MWARLHRTGIKLVGYGLMILVIAAVVSPADSWAAITPIPNPDPSPGSYGLEATKRQPPPTQGATIVTPSSGGSYDNSPITVSGLCPNGLLVQVYNNEVLVGAVDCQNGSFSLQVTLFTGQNDITATVFDDLGQAGPESNKVTVTYNNADFEAFGTLITLTSNYGRRAANPGTTLTWPLILSGGTGPYALSINWGDGTAPELKSQQFGGEFNITHVYSKSGVYHVTIKVTDVNGVSAFLQVVAIANGTPTAANTSGTNQKIVYITKVIWIPALICLLLLPVAYWLGRRSELVTLHKQLEKDMANYKEL